MSTPLTDLERLTGQRHVPPGFPDLPRETYPRVTSAALRDAARRLVELSRDGDAAAVGYDLRLLATFVVAPAAEDAQDREAMERGNSRTGEKP